ncbi:hypothetical protein D3C75_1118980 [compost metagenome]
MHHTVGIVQLPTIDAHRADSGYVAVGIGNAVFKGIDSDTTVPAGDFPPGIINIACGVQCVGVCGG